MKREAISMERNIKEELKELPEGAFFLVIANGDGTVSPLSMDKNQSQMLKELANMLSKEEPFARNTDVKLKIID